MDMKDHDKVCQAYWDIRARVQDDGEYARMREALNALEPQYAAALKKGLLQGINFAAGPISVGWIWRMGSRSI